MPPRMQPIFINCALLIGSLVVFIAVIEIGLRLTGIEKGRPDPPQIYQKNDDPDIGYELKPSLKTKAFRTTVTTDEHGFRSAPIDRKKPSIAILGDSIAFGYGVEDSETIPSQLALHLPSYTVINAAVPGYNLRQERATYEKKLRALDPKALVLVFYWNDLQDMVPGSVGADGNLYAAGSAPVTPTCNPIREGIMNLIPGKCWLDLHSAFYRIIKKMISRKTEKHNEAMQVEEIRNDAYHEDIPSDRLDAYALELDRLVAVLPPDFPRLFVIWPERPLHLTQRPLLTDIAEKRGFHVLDLYDVFGNNPETLSWDTVHPSRATDSTAASIIGDTLLHFHLLPHP